MPANLENIEQAIREIRTSKIVSCPKAPFTLLGITAATELDAGDTLGQVFKVPVPKRGVLYSANFYDLDDDNIAVDFEIFTSSIADVAFDAAYAPSVVEMKSFLTKLAFFSLDDHINTRTSELLNIGKAYTAPDGFFYIQGVTKGLSNIAAGAMPMFQMHILSDDPDFIES